MAYASRSGRARTSSRNPQAHAICDRCGFRWNFVDLQAQYEWRGASLQNTRKLVCRPCLDKPQEQLRTIIVPADPTPIINARVENYSADESDFLSLTSSAKDPTTGLPVPSSTTISTESGINLTRQPLDAPRGVPVQANMSQQGLNFYNVKVPVVSVISTGTNSISVTCSSIGSLVVGSQIFVNGLSNTQADGLYSIVSVVGNAFTYLTNSAIPAGSLLTGSSVISTANVGVPLDYPQVPSTGPVNV